MAVTEINLAQYSVKGIERKGANINALKQTRSLEAVAAQKKQTIQPTSEQIENEKELKKQNQQG